MITGGNDPFNHTGIGIIHDIHGYHFWEYSLGEDGTAFNSMVRLHMVNDLDFGYFHGVFRYARAALGLLIFCW